MRPFLVPLLAAVAASAGAQVCEAPFAPSGRDRAVAPSLNGLPGLFEVPGAYGAPDPSGFVAFNSIRTSATPGQTQQRNGFIGFGFLPRLTLVGRGSVMDNEFNEGMRDISASAQLLVAKESGWRPSIAIGAQDIGGQASNFESRYAVATKTLLGRVRGTIGFGRGDISLDGAFGGIEIAPCSWLTLIGENDSRRRNAGVRIAPLGDWGARRGIEPTFDVLWREGQGRMAGVGLRLQASNFGARPSRTATPRAAVVAAASSGVDALRDALVAQGFENVRVGLIGDTLDIAYENRVFNRDELDALGVVMGEAAGRGGTFRVLRTTLLRVDVPVLWVTTGAGQLRSFLSGELEGAGFAAQLGVDSRTGRQSAAPANSSRFHLDLTARPRVESLILTEISTAEVRYSILPEATVHLGRGVSVTGRKAYVVHSSGLFPQEYDEPNADRILLNVARPGYFFGGSSTGALTQVSVGRFGASEVGAAIQTDVPLHDEALSLGGTAAIFGEGFGHPRRSLALGTLRVRYAPLGLRTILTAGRFLHGDVGGSVEIERRYGLAEVAFFGQGTDIAKMVGVRISAPLTFARDLKPGAIRPRLPDYYDWRKWTQVLNPRNEIRADVATPIETGQDLVTTFRDRDRLNGVWLRSQVERLRSAAVRWVSP